MKFIMMILISSGLIFSFAKNNLLGQSTINPPSLEPVSMAVVSPNAASLGNYVEIPVGNYSGIPEIMLPIWNISYGDIKIPITLTYHAGGIKVDEIASWVGLGWALNNGGVISRSTRGNIDNLEFSYTKIKRYIGDSMSLTEKALFLEDLVFGRLDAEPDMYTLNVNGISCQFYQNSTGSYTTLPLDVNVKIERISTNRWHVTDPKGIKYIFHEIERNEVADVSGSSSTQVVTSWYLSRVEDRKGNFVEYSYTEELYNYKNKAAEHVNIGIVPINADCAGGKFVAQITENFISAPRLVKITYGQSEILFDSESNTRMDLNGGHALKYINIKNQGAVVKKWNLFTSYFENNLTGVGLTRYNTFTTPDAYRLKLDSLREESLSDSLPPYRFSYIIKGGLPYRLSNAQDHWGYYNGKSNNYDFVTYPDGITETGADKNIDPEYSDEFTLNKIYYPTGGYKLFEYESNSIPPTGTPYMIKNFVQLLGDNSVHRPGDDKEEFITTMELNLSDYTEYETITFSASYEILEDEPNSDCSFEFYLLKTGEPPLQLLQGSSHTVPVDNYTLMGRILQPTDGPGERYPVSYALTLNGAVLDSTAYKQRALAPGIRIKTIKNVDAGGVQHKKTFDYKDPDTGVSSGVISNYPHYEVQKSVVVYHEAGLNCIFKQYSAYSNYPLLNAKSGHTGYSYVTEYTDETLGKKVSKYTSFYEYSDLNMTSEFPFKPHTSQSWKRGLPMEESYFESVGNNYILKQKTFYKYGIVAGSTKTDYGIKGGAMMIPGYQSLVTDAFRLEAYKGDPYLISTDAFKLMSDSTIIYNNSEHLQVKNGYQYSSPYFQLNKKETRSSDQKVSVTEIKYPFEITGINDPSGVYQSMTSANMFDFPLEIKNIVDNKVTSLVRVNYTIANPDQFLPNTYESLNTSNNSYDLEHSFSLYTPDGNPLEESKRGNISTNLWGYKGQYLVAKIIGADWNAVKTEVDTMILNNGTDEQIKIELGSLRSFFAGNSLVQVFTYTYQPLVGITSETAPNGKTTYYEYDNFNRLHLIKDDEGKILKRICYNYAGQVEDCGNEPLFFNTAKSGTFTRNNCGAGFTGSSVTYTVPAGTFSAGTQAGADALAQADVDANGQIYANDNGICTPVPVTYYNTEKSGTFTRNNCGSGFTGGTVIYTVPANTFSATTQAAADALAQADVDANGQTYANAQGTCTPVSTTIYVKVVLQNYTYTSTTTKADVVLKFYSDAAGTIPVSVTNLTVNAQSVRSTCGESGGITQLYTFTGSGVSTVVLTAANVIQNDPRRCSEWEYSLRPGTGYTPL